jgi:hypothetical protein
VDTYGIRLASWHKAVRAPGLWKERNSIKSSSQNHTWVLCQERLSQPGIREGDVARREKLAKTRASDNGTGPRSSS